MADLQSRSYLSTLQSHCRIHSVFRLRFLYAIGSPQACSGSAKTSTGRSSLLEVGCGTGRNFPFLRDAVGPEGCIYGVDLSEGMLRRARKLCQRRQWTNFVLIETDAADYAGEELFDGVLFSFSYNVMPHNRAVLRQVWKQLRPGGRTRYRGCETTPRALWKADLAICHLVDEADIARQSSHSTLAIPR